jgi:hypothetical protein
MPGRQLAMTASAALRSDSTASPWKLQVASGALPQPKPDQRQTSANRASQQRSNSRSDTKGKLLVSEHLRHHAFRFLRADLAPVRLQQAVLQQPRRQEPSESADDNCRPVSVLELMAWPTLHDPPATRTLERCHDDHEHDKESQHSRRHAISLPDSLGRCPSNSSADPGGSSESAHPFDHASLDAVVRN